MTTPQDVLQIAIDQIGTKETPSGSNQTKYNDWYGMNHVPWAAIFVSYCFYHAGLPLEITTDKGFAYHPHAKKWFKDQGWWHSTPQIEDIVFFDWGNDRSPDSVGIVEKVNSDGSIVAIRGNVDNQVKRVNHQGSTIMGYGRPPYQTSKLDSEFDQVLLNF